jgi:hypothetical protein
MDIVWQLYWHRVSVYGSICVVYIFILLIYSTNQLWQGAAQPGGAGATDRARALCR